MRAIVHLGTYKTGTSSVQNMLHKNRDILAEAGVMYPTIGLVREKGKEELGFRHRGIIASYNRGNGLSALSSVVDKARSESFDSIILSCEAWSSPSNLGQLTEMVTDFEALGVSEISGIVTFRNLTCYQVSHFREFTVNRKNKRPYKQYTRALRPTFNYLLLLGAYRSIFGASLTVLPFSSVNDSRIAFLEAAGFGDAANGLDLTDEKFNVKSLDALGYEALRIANEIGIPHGSALKAITAFRENLGMDASTVWTERDSDDEISPNKPFTKRFAALSGWSSSDIDFLFHSANVEGRCTSEVTDDLRRAIAGGSI